MANSPESFTLQHPDCLKTFLRASRSRYKKKFTIISSRNVSPLPTPLLFRDRPHAVFYFQTEHVTTTLYRHGTNDENQRRERNNKKMKKQNAISWKQLHSQSDDASRLLCSSDRKIRFASDPENFMSSNLCHNFNVMLRINSRRQLEWTRKKRKITEQPHFCVL